MRITSPIIAIATLAGGTYAATNKEPKKRTKKQTVFHKDFYRAEYDTTLKSLLENAASKETRTSIKKKRRQQAQKDKPDEMELKTKVKREDVVKRSMEKRSMLKQRKQKEEDEGSASTDEADGSTTATESTAKKIDREAGAQPWFQEGGDRVKKQRSVPDTPTAGLRNEGVEYETRPTTPAPAAVPDDVQELMQSRRQGRTSELNRKKQRKERSARHVSEPSSSSGKKRRAREAPQQRKPNPRPGARKTSTMADEKLPNSKYKRDLRPGEPRPGYDKRDLKKSKKSSKSSSADWDSEDWGGDYDCRVYMTNLTKEQWFSEIFWMVHSDKVEEPLWEYGQSAFDDLALLAQDGDARELIDFYEYSPGVLIATSERITLEEGESVWFGIPDSGSYDLFTMATSFIFANDGFVSIDAGQIEDGRVWYLWGLDAGVEANTQLCWTVQASSDDFPPNSACDFDAKDDIADENDNQFPGEGFVHVHSGIHDLERNNLDDFLAFTCDELDVDSFSEYFFEIGFDDPFLLYDDDRERNEKDDEAFLDFVEDNDDLFEDFIIFQIAVEAGSFNSFCRDLEDLDDFLFNAFQTLEPQVFDFRTPMMRVELDC